MNSSSACSIFSTFTSAMLVSFYEQACYKKLDCPHVIFERQSPAFYNATTIGDKIFEFLVVLTSLALINATLTCCSVASAECFAIPLAVICFLTPQLGFGFFHQSEATCHDAMSRDD